MKAVALLILLSAFVAMSLEFGNDFMKWKIFNRSYITSSSCKRPCSVTRIDGQVTVNCTQAGCGRVPTGLRNDTTRLILARNRIGSISMDAFASLVNLIYLDLSFCRIKIIHNRTFDQLGRLEFLDLSYNVKIKRFPDGIFSKLRNLKQLNLERIQSSCAFDKSLFLSLEQLKILKFDGNNLPMFPNFQTATDKKPLLPKLRTLSLKANSIKHIAGSDFRGLEDSLETLNLNENQINLILANSFEKLIKLRRLQLDRNHLGTIQCNAFQSNTLEYLSIVFSTFKFMSRNRCQRNILHAVPNLKSLILTRSTGLRVATQPLSSQKHMINLNLKGTSLNNFHLGEIMKTLSNLSSLNIQDNLISSLNADLWNNLILSGLNIGRNLITNINATSFPQKLWNRLKRVDFSGNPFYCDCNLVWFRQWIHKTKTTVLSLKRTRCAGPPERKGHIVSETTKPTPFECFSADYDWCLLIIFLTCLAIVSAASVTTVLHRFRWYLKYWYFRTRTGVRRLQEALDETEYEFDAFVSYSESDCCWVVDTLCQMLENRFNLRLCLHHRDWMIGCDIVTNVVDSIERSRKTLMIVSNAFAVSQWCHFEMTMAQTKLFEEDRDNLILVLLEEIADCNMNPRLQLQMQKKTYVEWTENPVGQQLFWEKLRQALTRSSTSIINSTPPRELFISLEEL